MRFTRLLISASVLVSFALLYSTCASGQQVVQRGPFGRPAQILDETREWTTPFLLASDHDIEMYMPDVSSPAWLDANYSSFMDKEQYVLSFFTFYRTTEACRANQVAWGFSDGAHLDACVDIGYRIRRALVDKHSKTVTLIMAAMVGQDGRVEPDSVQTESITKTWSDLDPNTQAALQKSAGIVTAQMKAYDRRVQTKR
jgi:hypothetical protein